jgi:hypothetical protein
MSFTDLYGPCMACVLPCNGIINRNTHVEVDRRHVPRGFYSAAEPGLRRVVMFISANPGGGGDEFQEPEGAYDQPTIDERVNFQRGFVQGLFERPSRSFHNVLKKMSQIFLGLPWPRFAHHAVFTDLVKCTTPGDAPVPPETISTCANTHLTRELAAWQPVAVIALGDQAYDWLSGPGAVIMGDIPLRKLPHPSGWGKHATFEEKAAALRTEFNPDALLHAPQPLANS